MRYYTFPGIKELASGHVSISVLRGISLEDLLGRYPMTCQWETIRAHLQNKTVLITGGGGSIGSELCRQIVALGNVARLVIVDSNEHNLYTIDAELQRYFYQRLQSGLALPNSHRAKADALLAREILRNIAQPG